MRRNKRLGIVIMTALLFFTALGCGTPQASDTANSANEGLLTEDSPKLETTPAPVPNVQSGSLDDVLLDGVDLFVAANGYTFTQDERITLDITAENKSGSPATVWTLVTGINGWDVRSFPQAMTNIALTPGEKRSMNVTFDLSEPMARYLQIASISELTLSVEGYVDTTNYDYLIEETALQMPDVPAGYVQQYNESHETLVNTEELSIAYCGRDAVTGSVTLYCEAKTLPDDAIIKLYPIENGVYDTQRYLIPEVLTLQSGAKQLYTFIPPEFNGDAVTAFYLLADKTDMLPVSLILPNDADAQGTVVSLDDMMLITDTEQIALYYDKASRRFFARNNTADRVLTLTADATFLLDDSEVRTNPNTVFCFPGAATAFRISGRAKDAGGMERNVVIEQHNTSVSASFSVDEWTNGVAEPIPVSELSFAEFDLTGGRK